MAGASWKTITLIELPLGGTTISKSRHTLYILYTINCQLTFYKLFYYSELRYFKRFQEGQHQTSCELSNQKQLSIRNKWLENNYFPLFH